MCPNFWLVLHAGHERVIEYSVGKEHVPRRIFEFFCYAIQLIPFREMKKSHNSVPKGLYLLAKINIQWSQQSSLDEWGKKLWLTSRHKPRGCCKRPSQGSQVTMTHLQMHLWGFVCSLREKTKCSSSKSCRSYMSLKIHKKALNWPRILTNVIQCIILLLG